MSSAAHYLSNYSSLINCKYSCKNKIDILENINHNDIMVIRIDFHPKEGRGSFPKSFKTHLYCTFAFLCTVKFEIIRRTLLDNHHITSSRITHSESIMCMTKRLPSVWKLTLCIFKVAAVEQEGVEQILNHDKHNIHDVQKYI